MRKSSKKLPVRQKREALKIAQNLCEHYPMSAVIQNSYVLSRFWAWFSKVQVSPTVHIPVPRCLTIRDP